VGVRYVRQSRSHSRMRAYRCRRRQSSERTRLALCMRVDIRVVRERGHIAVILSEGRYALVL
jgi:hypothetical protein